jgi:hypothetical protein
MGEAEWHLLDDVDYRAHVAALRAAL